LVKALDAIKRFPSGELTPVVVVVRRAQGLSSADRAEVKALAGTLTRIDYNVFLMTRVREEAAQHGTREGAKCALVVITSAGIVLAGTFSTLAVLPLVQLTEIGFVIAFGVVLDTFLVDLQVLLRRGAPRVDVRTRQTHTAASSAAPRRCWRYRSTRLVRRGVARLAGRRGVSAELSARKGRGRLLRVLLVGVRTPRGSYLATVTTGARPSRGLLLELEQALRSLRFSPARRSSSR